MSAVFIYFLSVASFALFLYGFFPLQSHAIIKEIELPNSLYSFSFDVNKLYKEEVNRLVLVVIDALKYDFITQENMPFLMSAYKSHGCLLQVQVESPTVTLPRIKALTTGAVPQFADIILNLASTESLSDSILHKAKKSGKKIIFYGDDTWIKLFPNTFDRFEGVSSFYVNDFTEVDNNVTRNVIKELKEDDWDIMILHYLGLDHIGHKFGPNSHFVKPKLNEMDEIIHNVFVASQSWKKTLVAITGDHGMKDSGGHGGATYGETHVPFVALGVPCKNDFVAQVDLPVTLAALMGLQFPFHSIGRVSASMLTTYSTERLLFILRYNVLVLQTKIQEYQTFFHKASNLHYEYLSTKNLSFAFEAQKYYQDCAMKLSSQLIELSVKQNLSSLLMGVLFLSACLCTTFYKLRGLLGNIKSNKVIIGGNLIYLLSFLSSSFIEEEHQIWYFLTSTYLVLLLLLTKSSRTLTFIVLIVVRMSRTVNQTGDKWAHLPDLADWLILKENFFYHQVLFCISLVLLGLCFYYFVKDKRATALNVIILFLICLFEMYEIQWLVKFIWLLIVLNIVYGFGSVQYILISWTCIAALLMRPYNVILLPLCIFTSIALSKHAKSIIELTVIHIWFGRMYFFCQAHSNSLASVDVASGYVGVQEYIPIIVIMQVICHTYTFPILVNLLLLSNNLKHYNTIWNINILLRLSIMTTICFIILLHRHHLFVWTVFAPKLLIEFCHSVILMIQIVLFYGTSTLWKIWYEFLNKKTSIILLVRKKQIN